MDGRIKRPEGATGEQIWLRYATQFSAGGRTHTLEMSIALPQGASDELREHLLDEAEAGMDLLAGRVERRVNEIVQRNGQGNTTATAPTPKPPVRPASTPAAQTTTQPLQEPSVRERAVERPVEAAPTPPVVQRNTAPMVSVGDSGGNLPLPAFLSYIKQNLGLDSKQAMNLLKVKSLSNLNLRDALAQLEQMVGRNGGVNTVPAPASAGGAAQETNGTAGNSDNAQRVREMLSNMSSLRMGVESNAPAVNSKTDRQVREREQDEQITRPPVYQGGPIPIFDEETDPDEDALLDELDELEEGPSELTVQERVRAKTLISKLRESRGATTVNASRLQALSNVVDSQIGNEQLVDLVDGLWGVNALKKLKVDQVESLISWAKEDEFVSEVEAVMILLEEERYARGNR